MLNGFDGEQQVCKVIGSLDTYSFFWGSPKPSLQISLRWILVDHNVNYKVFRFTRVTFFLVEKK